MIVEETDLKGVLHIRPRVFHDDRGTFHEVWKERDYLPVTGTSFVQDNASYSSTGVLRGLHFQYEFPQGKLVSVMTGRIFDVAVDIRPDSRSFGRWVGVVLSADSADQLWVPGGFAHGFAALEPSIVMYKCTDYYHPASEAVLKWNDPAIGIAWPTTTPIVSARDAEGKSLQELDLSRLRVPSPAGFEELNNVSTLQ